MKEDPFAGAYRALSPKELAEMFMNPNAPKTEAEHWAVREIETLRAEVDRLTRDRRERIATAALQGMLACVENGIAPESWADFMTQRAVIYADALIAELDKDVKP